MLPDAAGINIIMMSRGGFAYRSFSRSMSPSVGGVYVYGILHGLYQLAGVVRYSQDGFGLDDFWRVVFDHLQEAQARKKIRVLVRSRVYKY